MAASLSYITAMNPMKPLFLVLALLFTAIAPGASSAQQRAVPPDAETLRYSFAPLVKEAAPAVVNIFTRKVVQQRLSPLFNDPFFRRFFGDNFGTPRERVQNSLGSGVIVRPDGLILTNHHVIDGADEIRVVLSDRREFPATLVYDEERTDLAVLKLEANGEALPHLELGDSDRVEVGDLVLAIGNPFGVGQTVTSGIVSAVARTQVGITDYSFFIQTDAAINPGNSGGALITLDGRLVGVNTAIYSRNNAGSVGIGFAVPSNMVRTVILAAETGSAARPWIGAGGQSVTADLASALGLPRPVGVLIGEVYPGGPADRAGLRQGDVVTHANGIELQDAQALRYRIATQPIGGTANLTVLRKGRELTLTFDLQPPPETPARDETVLEGAHPFAGAKIANLNPAYAEELGLDGFAQGVIVTGVARGSPADRLSLRPGDIVLQVNGRKIGLVRELQQALSGRAAQWQLSIRRGDRVLETTVQG